MATKPLGKKGQAAAGRFRKRTAAKAAAPPPDEGQEAGQDDPPSDPPSDPADPPADDQEGQDDPPSDPPSDPQTESPEPAQAASDPPQPSARKGGWPKGKARGTGATRERTAGRKQASGEQDPEAAQDRPRRRGSARGFTAAEVEAMAVKVAGAHQVVAVMTGAPELMLTQAEAMSLAATSMTVADDWGIGDMLRSKYMSLLAFVGTCAMVYVPRLNAIKIRQQRDAAASQASTVTDLTQPHPQPPYNEGGGAEGFADRVAGNA